MGFLEVLGNFPKKRVLVIGDVMLDKTIIGDVSRISPEAPVQIVNVRKEVYEPGGAANVAMNVSSLGGNVSLFGFVGKDDSAEILSGILNEKRVKCFFDKNSQTTVKLRVRSGNHQLLRLDYEETSPKNFSPQTLELMKEEINNSDIILLSDYAKGTITPDLMNFLKYFNKKIIINPKPKNMNLYSNSFLIICNEKEALEMSAKQDVNIAGKFLRENLKCNIIVTRGERGMMLFSDIEKDISTDAKEVYDVMGAGDTALAALSLSLISGASLEEAMIIANKAAGISVSKVGTYQVKLEELRGRIFGEEGKIKTFDALFDTVWDLKRKGKRIVWTNGKFDILHSAHVKYLKKAKESGDYLIVGLNSDFSFKRVKGREPINTELQRAEVLSAYADAIIIFSESDTTRYLLSFKPDIYVKGGDYDVNTINQEERKIIEGYGGKILIVNVGEDTSTSRIIQKIRELENLQEIKHIKKIWGEEIWMVNNENYCGKKLILNKGKRCSFHYHKIKDETFYLESGRILMEIGNETKIMEPGETIKIFPGIKHRFSGLKDSIIVEISTSHDEGDSYRVEDQLSGDIPEEIKIRYGVI